MKKSYRAAWLALLALPLFNVEDVMSSYQADDKQDDAGRVDENQHAGIMKKSFIKRVKDEKLAQLKADEARAEKATKEIELNSVNFLKFKEKLGEIFISNSDIADIEMLNDRSLYLSGKAPGTTALIIMNKEGKTVANYQIRVTYQIDEIKKAISKVFPALDLTISSIEDSVMLQGRVPSPEAAADIKYIVSKFVASDKIINKMVVETATQVMLKVKVAEVNRDLTKSFGLNWRTLGRGSSAFMGFANGSTKELIDNADNIGNVVTSVEGGRWVMASGSNNLAAFIDALATESYASVLAEPNLVALSGKSATFKSGGEYGYTVKQSTNSDSNTTEFKDWGTSVEFTPIVLSEDRISIKVKAEVSTIKTTKDTATPALETKNVETVVELGSGQSLALAGLLQTTQSSASSEVHF